MQNRLRKFDSAKPNYEQGRRISEYASRLIELHSETIRLSEEGVFDISFADRHLLGGAVQALVSNTKLISTEPRNSEEYRIRALRLARHVSRFASGLSKFFGMPLQKKQVNVCRLFRDVLDSQQHVISSQQIRIEHDFSSRTVFFDPHLLHVFLNELVGNAAKAVSLSTGARVIKLSCFPREGSRVIEVSDSGNAFEPTSEGAFSGKSLFAELGLPGSGKTLPKLRKVAEAYGARLELEKKKGTPTVARLVIPHSNREIKKSFRR